jgi:hypothetical protein
MKALRLKLITEIEPADPLYQRPHKYAWGSNSPKWSKRQTQKKSFMGHYMLMSQNVKSDELEIKSDENYQERLISSQSNNEKDKETDDIKITSNQPINFDQYPLLFKNKVF